MKKSLPIKTLFVDVGEVLLTNGWDDLARRRAAKHFELNWAEMNERHRPVFEIHEEGKLPFEEYLAWVVFHQKRAFTRSQFRNFMLAQSKPYPRMIGLVAQLKIQHGLKVIVISNESRELNAYRIRTFKLDRIVDALVSSCFVGMQKPDVEIFRLAINLAQTPVAQSVFIDNTPMFVQIAERPGDAKHSSCQLRVHQRRTNFTPAADERRNLAVSPVRKGDSECQPTSLRPRTCFTKLPMR